ncbi:LAQU0S03e03422g1_1 [Lachancea quebecensis]|uniref:DNA repair and recombination protein RDH54 n=1 Tax=Lachancea quebecensis TaxID=1654605 RepID=A0A0P1KNF7_9SACH|nr:LAQU0S03e03422g1_1 [Lachancea quebecensis]
MRVPQYVNKPFKSPVISRKPVGATESPTSAQQAKAPTTARPLSKRAPLDTAPSISKKGAQGVAYYSIIYRKRSTKKHKTWDGDGTAIEMNNGSFRFYKDDGRFFGSGSLGKAENKFDKIFTCSGCEVQLDHQIEDEQETSKLDETLGSSVKPPSTLFSPSSGHKVQRGVSSRSPSPGIPVVHYLPTQKFKPAYRSSQSDIAELAPSAANTRKFPPIFDPSQIEDPLIMNTFTEAESDVIVDPILSKHLRPHQRVGVKFMYDCVMGLSRPLQYEDDGKTSCSLPKTDELQGCLLADEMGLGKTLMTITLIWTLLKQTPTPSKENTSQFGMSLQGLCNKVLVVCPVTLIANWKREFSKWLGLNRIGVLTLDSKSTPEKDRLNVRNFLRVQRTYQVLIIGYEKLLSVTEALQQESSSIGLMVCDEGHRLKNGQSKTLSALNSLDISRKVLLTGTPIQNDLTEFFTIIDFLNCGVMGTFSQFKRDYINPITRARDVNNKFNEIIQAKGKDRTDELIDATKRFTLRRTADTISKFLPPKTDIVLFCKPTETQIRAFQKILTNAQLDFSSITPSSSLALITLFKKICNSPSLISQDSYYLENIKSKSDLTGFLGLDSGKLRVLLALLENIRTSCPQEKVVIVSNYTQTLDIIQNILESNRFSFTRLDGNTPTKERDRIVRSFNTVPSLFAFLLSAKSGGVGLNLIGASRLVLFDNDWNPAIDLQAMSRIHRDGQRRPCFIYRLLTTGCIDEKIFQRQLMKNSLSFRFMGDQGSSSSIAADDNLFETNDLKDLFSVLVSTRSNTHDLICTCHNQKEQAFDLKATDAAAVKAGTQGWTSAMDLMANMEKVESEKTAEKAALVQQCLVDYEHVKTLNAHRIVAEAALESQTDVTFAFIKSS